MKSIVLLCALVAIATALPTNFDARNQWPGCVDTILDQGQCGSCWDFCSVESFANRMCITGEDSSSTIVSPEPILECSRYGCNGGYPKTAWNYLINNGGTTCTQLCKSGCAPYDSYDGTSPSCHSATCDNNSPVSTLYYAGSFNELNKGALSTFQTELYNHGPLQACFNVYNNFYTYFSLHPNGIYTSYSGSLLGGHCVKMVGWGTDSGQDYWTFANSWGTSWGNGGFFRMARGGNLCDIESQVTEGFTKKQTLAVGIPVGTINVTSEFMTGGWTMQSNMPEFEQEIKALIDLVFPGENIVSNEIETFETQVVAGVNYRMQSTVTLADGTKMKAFGKMHRNLSNEFSLMEKSVAKL